MGGLWLEIFENYKKMHFSAPHLFYVSLFYVYVMFIYVSFLSKFSSYWRFHQPESKRAQYISYDGLISILKKMRKAYHKNFKSAIS